MNDPYVITNDTFLFSNGSSYVNASEKSAVELSLVSQNASTMCVSVNDSNCSNYVNFANTYTLDLSDEEDGEKVIYVYYKDISGNIFASLNKSIILDTAAPTNNTVTIGAGAGLSRDLTISSTGASKMCFSNTSNVANDCLDWIDYTSTTKWRLSDGTGNKTVYAFFKDVAGNISTTTASIEVTSIVEFTVNEDFTDTTYDSNITITDGDTYPWSVVDGQFQSTNQGVNSSTSSSTISFTPTVDAILFFDYGVSSESGWDKLTITLTGSDSTSNLIADAISGTTTGSATDISLTAGVTYTLTLSYTKDSSGASNSDIGYIDNLVIQSQVGDIR